MRHPSGAVVFYNAYASACRPRKLLTVSEWADAHREMTSKSTSQKGRWRTSLVPFAREPMDALSERSQVQEITLMKPAQSAGTEIALNWIGYVVDHAPGPMLYVLPTLDVRERFVKQRLNSMLVDTPALASIFDAKRKRDASNSESIKDFPGGILILSGANSPASLGAMPIKYVVADELDRFPWEAGHEGDPDGLITQRQATFARRKKLNISTPTMADNSRIEEKYKQSDMRQYHVPCPHCGAGLVLQWPGLQWRKNQKTGLVEAVWYACTECGGCIEEHHKPKMLADGEWIPRHPERSALHRGYHWNALYSPLGLGFRWIELVRQWLEAQNDTAKLKRFVNTVLAETWEDRTRDVRPNLLMERAEPYHLRQVPPGFYILTAAIDVQDDRLEFTIVAWGPDRWAFVDYFVLPGSPGQMLEQACRGEGPVIEYLNTPLRNAYGKALVIQATGVDTGGHYTHEVYNFVRAGKARRLMALKGANHPNRTILATRPTAQDINHRGKTIKGGAKLWTVGTDTAKHMLFNALMGDADIEPDARKVHFSQELPPEFFEGLTAEAFDPEHNRWVKRRGRRNEPLDLFVYAAAASQHPELRVHAMRKHNWDAIAQLLEPAGAQPDEQPIAMPAIQPMMPAGRGRRQRSKGVVRR